jgi:hypothetical protein
MLASTLQQLDSSLYSGNNFIDFRCLEKVKHWMKRLSVSSWFFTVVFSVGNEIFNRDACSTCAPIFIFSLTEI